MADGVTGAAGKSVADLFAPQFHRQRAPVARRTLYQQEGRRWRQTADAFRGGGGRTERSARRASLGSTRKPWGVRLAPSVLRANTRLWYALCCPRPSKTSEYLVWGSLG